VSGGRRRVEAAGGLVVRGPAQAREVAIVHRPRYDDWSLPKGKLESGESFEAAALREVEEETGLRCRPGPELEANSYTDHKGRPKLVRWWLMEPEPASGVSGAFEPNDEVDELAWLTPDEAAARVDYDHDRKLIEGLGDGPER